MQDSKGLFQDLLSLLISLRAFLLEVSMLKGHVKTFQSRTLN